jgi:hypothetical protein
VSSASRARNGTCRRTTRCVGCRLLYVCYYSRAWRERAPCDCRNKAAFRAERRPTFGTKTASGGNRVSAVTAVTFFFDGARNETKGRCFGPTNERWCTDPFDGTSLGRLWFALKATPTVLAEPQRFWIITSAATAPHSGRGTRVGGFRQVLRARLPSKIQFWLFGGSPSVPGREGRSRSAARRTTSGVAIYVSQS